jgi:hypothetical protein
MSAKSTNHQVKEFTRDLRKIQVETEDEARVYREMPQEGKQKCLVSLQQTIQTLQKIQKDLKSEASGNPDPTLIQVLWSGNQMVRFTKDGFTKGFEDMNRRVQFGVRLPVTPILSIASVDMKDGYILDSEKFLKATCMCFVKFSTEEDAYMALGIKNVSVRHQPTETTPGILGGSHVVEFVQPAHSQAALAEFKYIGGLLQRLEDINKELTDIGAVRVHGGMPELSTGLIDRAWYLAGLEEFKMARAAGMSLNHHVHGPLAGKKPVDTEALKVHIKRLYDEECDVLIQLREFQLNGTDFNFKHPAFSMR